MKDIPSRSIDLIITDLPYGTTNCKWDLTLDLPSLWSAYRRIAKPNAAVLLFAQTPFDKILGCSNIHQLRYELIWEKSNATGHLNAKRMPMKAHENILVFYDKLPTYNPQKTQNHVRKTATKRHNASEIYGSQDFDALEYNSTERYPRSVLAFPSDKQRCAYHPTQKPLALCEYLVKTYSNPNDVVLDSCMGSGTTGVAAVNLNRKFIGVELDGGYFKIAKDRIESAYDIC
jgi:site-specific DNA-methyltransferase (adenine-specific)